MRDISITEKNNINTKNIDISSSDDIVKMINEEDKKVAYAVEKALPEIAKAIDIISDNFINNGRLIYFGAGTSGRLGILDASECPPTFGVSSDMVKGVIAGGDVAIKFAVEGAEDSVELAKDDFEKLNIKKNDTIVVISASGNANYVYEILLLAKQNSCKTIAVSCNPKAKISVADVFICAETGEEVLTGSTRMKAGTAQKMVLNMLTTGAMIKIGKAYENFMVDVKPTNIKLKDRAVRIVSQISGYCEDEALNILEKNNFQVKPAILMLKYNISYENACTILKKHNGILRKSFEEFN